MNEPFLLKQIRCHDGVLEKRSILQTELWMPALNAAEADGGRRTGINNN